MYLFMFELLLNHCIFWFYISFPSFLPFYICFCYLFFCFCFCLSEVFVETGSMPDPISVKRILFVLLISWNASSEIKNGVSGVSLNKLWRRDEQKTNLEAGQNFRTRQISFRAFQINFKSTFLRHRFGPKHFLQSTCCWYLGLSVS